MEIILGMWCSRLAVSWEFGAISSLPGMGHGLLPIRWSLPVQSPDSGCVAGRVSPFPPACPWRACW